MPKLILDEYSNQPISRQRKYQLRRESKGLCRICGGPGGPLCAKHKPQPRHNNQPLNPLI